MSHLDPDPASHTLSLNPGNGATEADAAHTPETDAAHTPEVQIRVRGLYKIFGKHPRQALDLLRQGRDKTEILATTGQTVGLNNIHLEIHRGELFVIMGLSGSGKSTLIRHFNRLIDPTAGQLEVEGIDVLGLNRAALRQFRRHKVSMVFQRFALLPHKTVLENVAFGLTIQGVPRPERLQRARRWLADVGLTDYAQQYPAHLSGGQQQRVGLARALCTDADILLMDEAFSALDPIIRSEMQDQLVELQARLHKTIVFITHDLDEALRIGGRIAILRDGELIQVGTPGEILLHPADAYVEAFVRDVNRTRVLTVATVMRPPAFRISARSIDEALAQMRSFNNDWGYQCTPEGTYQGVLKRQRLEQEQKHGRGHASVQCLLEDVPAIPMEVSIETVLPETLEADVALPVLDPSGQWQGLLSRQDVSRMLAGRATRPPRVANSAG
jgi:glycine betaine/proline transport system ATP-binding protein